MSNIEDKVIARKKAEEKRQKQFKNHGERLREINDSLRKQLGFQKTPRGRENQKVYLLSLIHI